MLGKLCQITFMLPFESGSRYACVARIYHADMTCGFQRKGEIERDKEKEKERERDSGSSVAQMSVFNMNSIHCVPQSPGEQLQEIRFSPRMYK